MAQHDMGGGGTDFGGRDVHWVLQPEHRSGTATAAPPDDAATHDDDRAAAPRNYRPNS
jgi:hypothetical protein